MMYGPARARRNLYILLVLGLAAMGWGLWNLRSAPFFRYIPVIGAFAPADAPRPTALPTPTPGMPTREQVIALIQAYNQADIQAERTNSLSGLLPYIHPDGPLYERLAAEFRRRIAAGETRNVQITRFWAGEPRIGSEEITIETQEIWDVTVVKNGEIASSQVGVVSRQRYTIRRDAGGAWRIWELEFLEGGYLP